MKASQVYSSIGRVAGLYDILLRLIGYEKSVASFVAQLPVDTAAPVRVLDAGCGTGLYTLAVLKRFPFSTVTAFDFDSALVERLKQKLQKRGWGDRARLFSADIQNPSHSIGQEKFDVIITAGVLEYVPLEKTVRGLSQFLVSGGYFLHAPVKNSFLGRLIGWLYVCKPYSRTKNIEVFTQSGFILKKIFLPRSFKELHIFQKSGS